MSIRSAAWIAWSLCLLCVALAGACLIFSLLNGHTLYEMVLTGIPTTVILLTQMVSFSVVGAVIASHRPRTPSDGSSAPLPSSMGSRSPERSTLSMRSSRILALFPWERSCPG